MSSEIRNFYMDSLVYFNKIYYFCKVVPNQKHRIWNRLLYFIWAVGLPAPTDCSISPPE